jgi:N-acetylornithine carbamoyltransferase
MNLRGRSFLRTQDWSRDEIEYLLQAAAAMKREGHGKPLAGKSLALLFFNASLRTRSSFELAMYQLGGHAVTLQPGKDAWAMEWREGAVMDGEAEEHLKEGIRVLSRFFDALAVRCFPRFQNWAEERKDPVLTAIANWSSKPVINMETILHPCQELALALTLKEHLGTPAKRKFLLTWTYHPKPLNTAVANSAALIATKLGMDLTILRPPGYDLDAGFMRDVTEQARQQGGSVRVTDDIDAAYRDAEFVYAKSWGSLDYYGRWEQEKPIREKLKHFIVDARKMGLTRHAKFSHCLPMRRNVKATDEVADAPYSLIIDEAENRLHTTRALLAAILGEANV